MAFIIRQRFYPQMALALALIVIVGFSQTYYLRFLSDQPPLVTLVHLHGIVFTAWLALFAVQTQLIARDRVDLHMKLGVAGAVLALLVLALGLATAFYTAATPRLRASGLSPAQFSIVPLMSILLFAVFVGLGLALRHRPAAHKRLMVLAMIATLGPAVGRIAGMFAVGKYGFIVQTGVAAVLMAWCLIYDWRRHALIHPVFVIGGAVVVLSSPGRMAIARSEWWEPVSEWIASVGAGL